MCQWKLYTVFQDLIGDSPSDATLLLDESSASVLPQTSDSEGDDIISFKPGKKRSICSGSEDESFEPARKNKKIVKTEDDCTPLPDPFTLPKHFPQDMEVALKRKKLSSNEKRRFIFEIASAMLRFPHVKIICVFPEQLWRNIIFSSQLMLNLVIWLHGIDELL